MAALAARDLATARRHQHPATRLVAQLVRLRSSPFLKTAMEFTGLPVGPTRHPLRPDAESEHARLQADLDGVNVGWILTPLASVES